MDYDTLAAARVGTTLCHKWTLEKLLGVGGMAAVYVASHKIGRREAIKILHREVAQQPDMLARFEQEAHAVNRFQHPGAVEIRDIDVAEDGSPFLVMELLAGESLGERVRRLGDLPLDEILRLTDDLLDVLAAAHARGIIHRDIKLDNLFVQTDGRLKVLDFGIARIRDGVPLKMRTRAGATLGTAPYMPPEQIKGLEIDARADLFAVGATMFRLIAKRRIHEAKTETEMLLKMASLPAPPLLSVAPETPPGVGQVVDRALRFDREQRYPDALTMQSDVRAVRAGLPPPNAAPKVALDPAAYLDPVTVRPGQQASPERTAATAIVSPAAAPPASPAVTPMVLASSYAAMPVSLTSPASSYADPATQNRPSAQQLGPERTLKSAQSLDDAPTAAAAVARFSGSQVLLVSPAMPPAEAGPLSVSLSRGPASAPVVSIVAPRPPQKRPVDRSLLLAILIGAVFLLLGVGITLALTLGRSRPTVEGADAAPSAQVAEPPAEDGDSIGWGRLAPNKKPASTAAPKAPLPNNLSPEPPAPAPAPAPPGKGKAKGR
jgi:serine/threonine protein kinase